MFQYGVHSVGVLPSHGSLHTRPNICFCLLHLPLGIRHNVPADGSRDTPSHVSTVERVTEQGRTLINQPSGIWWHPEEAGGVVSDWGGAGSRVLSV